MQNNVKIAKNCLTRTDEYNKQIVFFVEKQKSFHKYVIKLQL